MSIQPIQSVKSGLRAVAFILATDMATQLFALMIIAANVVAIGGPIIIELTGGVVLPQFDVMTDRSYPEMLNYAQQAMCTLLFLATFLRTRQALFLGFALVFAAIGLDDSFSYHEQFGSVLVQQLHLPAVGGLRDQDSGELLAWVIEATILVPLLLITALRANTRAAATAAVLVLCIAGLAFCGAGLDMLHILIDNRVIGYLEDGGEMLCIAAACISTFALYRTAWGHNPQTTGPHYAALRASRT